MTLTFAERSSLRERLRNPATMQDAREELRSRIIRLVEIHGESYDLSLWQKSGPEFLPWEPMFRELRALNAERKLILDIRAPGCCIVRPVASTNGKPRRKAAAARPKRKR
jgi:hypothetical protein